MLKAITTIDQILSIIEEYQLSHPQHKDSCEFLKDKYQSLKESFLNKSTDLDELIEWNKWIAPRIIYDGINHKPLLNCIEKLRELL